MKIALFVELGELMNEFPTKFKHWKSSAKDDREKGLEEYVDCLHFALSLTNYSMNRGKWKVNESWEYEAHNHNVLSLFDELNGCVTYIKEPLSFLFAIGNKLGFTWDEIYHDYTKKNEINYQRLRSGY